MATRSLAKKLGKPGTHFPALLCPCGGVSSHWGWHGAAHGEAGCLGAGTQSEVSVAPEMHWGQEMVFAAGSLGADALGSPQTLPVPPLASGPC